MYVLALVLGLLSPAPDKKAPSPGMAIDDLISKTQKRMADDTAMIKTEMMFNQIEITEHLNEDGTVATTKSELFLVYGAQHETEGMHLAKLPLEIDGQQILGQPRWMDGFIDETFFDRFRFSWTDTPVADCGDGLKCYVVSFWPKDNPPYNGTHKQKIFNLLMGVLYIDKSDFILRRGEARLSKPYGIFGIGCKQLDIKFTFGEYKGIEVSLTYDITTRFKEGLFDDEQYKHHSITNSGFRKRPSP